MADYSGIGALGNGLSSFADAYLAAKKQKDTNDLQQAYLAQAGQSQQAGLLAKNMQINPDTNEVEYNPQGLLQQQNQRLQAQNENTQLQQQAQNEQDSYTTDTPYAQQHRQANRAVLEQIAPGQSQKIYPDNMTPAQFEASGVGSLIKDYAPIASAKVKGQYGEDTAKIKQQGQADKGLDAQFQKFSDAIDPNRARSGNLGQLQDRLNKADRIDQLVQKANDNPKGLTKPEMQELATSTAALLKGSGSVSEGEINGLMPSTARSKYGSIVEYLSNEPQALDNKAFVNNYKNLVDRERQVTTQQLKDAAYGKVAAYEQLDQKDHNRFKSILDGQGQLGYDDYQAYKQQKAAQKSGGLLGATPSGASGQSSGFSSDVIDYAKTHNISPAQAQSIKEQRMKSMQNPSPGGA